MGNAKRRKQLDPNYGKPFFEIKLDIDFVLSPELKEACDDLDSETRFYEKAIVTIKGEDYPIVFIPFVQKYKGKPKLYAQFATTQPKLLILPQAQTDRMTQEYCRGLLQRGKLPRMMEKQLNAS